MNMGVEQIAAVLEEMGTLLELQGANPFKSRAFHAAARTIEGVTDDLAQRARDGTLREIKGIGEGLAKVIADLTLTGRSKEHDELRKGVPVGVLEMTRLQGLGPKRVRTLWMHLKLASVEALAKACAEHRVASLEGFGEKTEENILRAIESQRQFASRWLYAVAEEAAEPLLSALRAIKGVELCEAAGSLRRRRETIGDIDILVAARPKAAPEIRKTFTTHPLVTRVVNDGETKCTVQLGPGMLCDMRIVAPNEFPFALNYFTGSKEHNVEMRVRARKLGLSLNEYAFTRLPDGPKRLPRVKEESDIYQALGLSFVPPEMRENQIEFNLAQRKAIPELVRIEDIRGTVHCHTTYSDGRNTLAEMVEASQALGWSYWGVADHSAAAAYAGGLQPKRVKQQHREIDQIQAGLKGFRIFRGTECDIMPDGSLDYPARVLAGFDYVVVSIHNKFNMTEAEATKRLVKAVTNKYTTILGHPTGRLLLGREGYPVNMREVLKAAADHGKAIEINSHPLRLDLDWRWLSLAKELGVRIFINPDAHTAADLTHVRYGVGIARKGGLEPSDIVNTWTTSRVEKFFRQSRGD
ncbi:MAG: DNA polymerase/3'-5' exonuclease PolX [Bacteroidetes bacterium]|jgi:DNA polymerase (family 10)|nr:DNA polymerase/3'-5' exonuclease PolX [Bacteroidota bacterium]